MRLDNVEIPQRILEARKQGKLVIFAGAGVSMDAPSNYPDFLELAQEIGVPARPKLQDELIDRYLGRLEQEGVAVHDQVQRRLSLPSSRPNRLHHAIVRLFGSADSIRIVTTNFDGHFQTAAEDIFGVAPNVYRAPTLPLGDEFTGIVHVHGSVEDPSKTLVLTDADFGRAYLTQGWARRFVQPLFAEFVVLFVGYSHQDLPLLYLARGISAASPGPGRYAFSPETNDTHWQNLGITPVHYPLRAASLGKHGALGDCLNKWADIANLGSLGTEEEIRRIVTIDRPESPEESDFLQQALLELRTLRFFTRHARHPRWLEWISDKPEFKAIFSSQGILNERAGDLAFWFTQTYAIDHFGDALELVRRNGQTLSSALWHQVALCFHQRGAAGTPMRFWTPILLNCMPTNPNADLLAYMIRHCTMPEDKHTVLQLFRRLTAPVLQLRRRYSWGADEKAGTPDAEVVPIGKDYWVNHVYSSHLKPHLDVLAKDLAVIVTSAFEEARSLSMMYGKAGPKWDPISFSRGATASRAQDHLHNGFSALIDAGADVLRWGSEYDHSLSSALIRQWIDSDAPILRRLATTGMTASQELSAREKLAWVTTHCLLQDWQLKNEAFALLAEIYASCRDDTRAAFLTHSEQVYRLEGEGQEDRYEWFNLLSWLHTHAPHCEMVTGQLQEVQSKHPEWGNARAPRFQYLDRRKCASALPGESSTDH